MMRASGGHGVYFIATLKLGRSARGTGRHEGKLAVARSSDTIHLKAVRPARWSLVGMPGQSGEELLWLVIRAAGVGIFETDLKRQRTRFSKELCELLGLPSGTEMATAEAWQVVHERDRS